MTGSGSARWVRDVPYLLVQRSYKANLKERQRNRSLRAIASVM